MIEFNFQGASFVSGIIPGLSLTEYIPIYGIIFAIAFLFSFDYGWGKFVIEYSSEKGWAVTKK